MNKTVQTMTHSEAKRFGTFKRATSKAFSLITILALCAGCSKAPTSYGFLSSESKMDRRYNVAASPRVIRDGRAIPKGGGRAISGGKPYMIAGRVYHPKNEQNYHATGTASWYGDAFHGRRTANGEIFDKHSIVAAHPTLPLPSYVRVTNLHNSRSMIVRVNDRGPFHGRRLIDLSQRAAELLGFKNAGTAPVRVEYMGRASLRGSDDRKLISTLMGPFAQDSSQTSQSEQKHQTPQNQYASLTTSFKENARTRTQSDNPKGKSVPALRASIDPTSQAEMAALAQSITAYTGGPNIKPRVLSQMLRDGGGMRTARLSQKR